MASLNQIASELVHSVGQPNNFALRENVKAAIVHTRNELIRHSMTQHGYVDSVLQQRYKVSLVSVGDGDIDYPENFPECCKTYVKRTKQKVPRPVRFTNNLPFTRVSNVGYKFNVEIPYIKETSAQFRRWLPGMRGCVCYDYINDYGMYDKIFPFVVCFKNGEFDYLNFHDMKRSDYKTVEAYGIRDYLEELYWELEDKIKKILAEE